MRSISLPHNHGSAIERHIDSIPKTEDFQNLSDVFRLLGDSSRLRIFWILCHCEECVMLKASKLIVSRRDGKEVYYQAAHTEQAELLHQMIETLLAITCPGSCQT